MAYSLIDNLESIVSIYNHSGRFTQADTIVPSPADPQSWDRYAYVKNNPLRYTDPSGNKLEEGAGNIFIENNRLIWANGFSYFERIGFEKAAKDVAEKYAEEINRYNTEQAKRYGDEIILLSPAEAFHSVHDGIMILEKQYEKCTEGCWGRAINQNLIYIYSNMSTQNIMDNPRFLVHEIAHTFENSLAQNGYKKIRWSLTSDMMNRNGFMDRGWQFGGDDSAGEILADMFVHWIYDTWLTGSQQERYAGRLKENFMNMNMSFQIQLALH